MKQKQLFAISFILIALQFAQKCKRHMQSHFIEDQSISNLQQTTEIDLQICTSELIPSSQPRFGVEPSTLRERLINGSPDLDIEVYWTDPTEYTSSTDKQWQIWQIGLPWLAMAAFSLLEMACLSFCYSDWYLYFQFKSCPLWLRCKRSLLTRKEVVRYSIGIVFCTLLIIASTVTGMQYYQEFMQNAEHISCTLIQMVQSISIGSNEGDFALSGWIGLKGILGQLNNIHDQFNRFRNESTILPSKVNVTQLNESYTTLLSINQQIPIQLVNYSYYANNSVVQFFCNMQISYLVNRTIKTQDGYVAASTNSILHPQQQLFQDLYNKTINLLAQIQINAQTIVNLQTQINSAISNTQLFVSSANQELLQLYSQLVDFNHYITNDYQSFSLVFKIYFGTVLGVNVIIAILITLIGFKNMKYPSLRYLLSGSCCIWFVTVIVGFMFCTVFAILNVTLAQSCNFFYITLQNSTAFNSIKYFSKNQDFMTMNNECMFGQGNLLEVHNLMSSLDKINDLQVSINGFNIAYSAYNSSLPNTQLKLKANLDFINKMINGTIIDYPNGPVPNKQFIKSQEINWQPIFVYENSTLAQNNRTQQIFNSSMKNLTDYIANVSQFLAYISATNTGLLNNANCGFMKNITAIFVDSLCDDYFDVSYSMYVLMAMISVPVVVALFLIFKILISHKDRIAQQTQNLKSGQLAQAIDHNDILVSNVTQFQQFTSTQVRQPQQLPFQDNQQLCAPHMFGQIFIQSLQIKFNQINRTQHTMVYQHQFIVMQRMWNYGAEDSTIFPIIFEETRTLQYAELQRNPQKLFIFRETFLEALAIDLRVSKSEITIISCCEGALRVKFSIDCEPGKVEEAEFEELGRQFPESYLKLELNAYFDDGGVGSQYFAFRFNKSWDGYPLTTRRGPNSTEYYYYPIGWQGYGLNVLDQFGNDGWLDKDGNQNEWVVMFHGIYNGQDNDVFKKILDQGLIPGSRQLYKDSNCIRTGQIIGRGVYFSNKVSVCEEYAAPIIIENKSYKVVMQSRVNPHFLKECPTGNPQKQYFVINDSRNIRPYRVLLKEQISEI